jgi:hypothetical protein
VLKSDYMTRLVEQIGLFLGRLLKKLLHSPGSVEAEADEALRTLTGLDLATVRALPPGALMELVRRGTEVDPGRTLAIAEILAVQAEADAATGAAELARTERHRAAALYLESFLTFRDEALAESMGRAEALLARMVDEPLPVEVATRLVRYREREGRFADAENVLFELLRVSPTAAGEVGLAFFRRLQALPDEDLAAGSLPREEVEEGLAELEGALAARSAADLDGDG